MIEVIKKNFVILLLLIFTLVVVNSFISLNKNFYKTEIKKKIVFYEGEDVYENFKIREFIRVINLTKSDLISIMRKLNISYFGHDNKNKIKITNSSFNKTDKEIIFFNKIYIYDKFDKKEYEQFILRQFKLNLLKTLSQLKIKKKNDLKSSTKECLVRKAIIYTQNPNKNYKEFAKTLDEVYDTIYSKYLTPEELQELVESTDSDIKKYIFLYCVKNFINKNFEYKNGEMYFLKNFNDFQNKNFDIRLEFTNYKNDKLIYFLNFIIILTFISVYFSIKSINNFLKRKTN